MRKILFFSALIIVCLVNVTVVLAAPKIDVLTNQTARTAGYDTQGTTDTTISETVGKVIRYSIGFLGTIFLVLTIYAGVLRGTAGGNEEQVSKSNNIFKMSLVGAIIIVSAYSITTLVFKYLVTPGQVIQDIKDAGPQIGTTDSPGCCYYKDNPSATDVKCLRGTRSQCQQGTFIFPDDPNDGNSGPGYALGNKTVVEWKNCSASEYRSCQATADLHPDDNNIWGGEVPDLPVNQ